jgi:lipid-binding SYLF domain-containing protein
MTMMTTVKRVLRAGVLPGPIVPATVAAVVTVLVAGLLAGCSTTPSTKEAKDDLSRKAAAERQQWASLDPDIEPLVRKSQGFAFFPEILKGGVGVGGAYGRGVVYEQGQHIGYADLTQGSLGLQLGGQSYSELIVFADKAAMDRFKQGQIDFSANASAVVAKTGAAKNVRFVDGVAIFVRPTAGAMGEAVVAGQRVTYAPK